MDMQKFDPDDEYYALSLYYLLQSRFLIELIEYYEHHTMLQSERFRYRVPYELRTRLERMSLKMTKTIENNPSEQVCFLSMLTAREKIIALELYIKQFIKKLFKYHKLIVEVNALYENISGLCVFKYRNYINIDCITALSQYLSTFTVARLVLFLEEQDAERACFAAFFHGKRSQSGFVIYNRASGNPAPPLRWLTNSYGMTQIRRRLIAYLVQPAKVRFRKCPLVKTPTPAYFM